MENPAIRDINGEEVLFQMFDVDIRVRYKTFRRAYLRDCSDCGAHLVPLRVVSAIAARDCLASPIDYRSDLNTYGTAAWVSDAGLWVELRIEDNIEEAPVLLCFIWDRHTTLRTEEALMTYITEDYWRKWQRLIHGIKA